jgi:hypothetical protein
VGYIHTIAAALQWLPARVMFVVFPDGIPSGRRPLRQNSRYLYGQTRALPLTVRLLSSLFSSIREERRDIFFSLLFLSSSLLFLSFSYNLAFLSFFSLRIYLSIYPSFVR